MHIENATRTRAFVIPLVENCASPEGEPVDEFLHVLEDSFSHDEVWPQPYDRLYVSLRSRRSVGKEPDGDEHAEPARQFDTEPAVEPEDLVPLPSYATTVEPEDLEPVPSAEVMGEDSHQPDMHLDDAGNEPDMPANTDDLPDVSMDRPLRVTFGKKLRYAPTMAVLICCRPHRDGTLQSVPLPKVGPNTPYASSLKGTHGGVHQHSQCKDLTSLGVSSCMVKNEGKGRKMTGFQRHQKIVVLMDISKSSQTSMGKKLFL